jgi:hypothetical protein
MNQICLEQNNQRHIKPKMNLKSDCLEFNDQMNQINLLMLCR